MTRAEAKAAGEKYYFTGVPCIYGHVAPRQTANGGCTVCINIRKSQDNKQYRERHRDKLLEYDKLRYKAAPTRRQASKDKRKAAKRRYYLKYKNEILGEHAKYRDENAEKLRGYFKQYRQANKEKITADRAKARAAKKQRVPKWVDAEELFLISEVYDLAQRRTKMTNFTWHVDHILPLQGGLISGLHVIKNLQVIPAKHNLQKGNKCVIE